MRECHNLSGHRFGACRKVVLDTSGEALRHAIEARPNIIKPNIHELEALVGKPLQTQTEVVDAAKNLVAGG